jgi:uncharacterized protein (DUF1330 family)
MAAYMIVLGKSRSPEWLAEYVAKVPDIFRRCGGEYLGVAKRIKQFEGPPIEGNLAAIFSFPTLENVNDFMTAADYQPLAELRKKNMDAILFAFDTNE